jgi:hypothetical protein
MLPGYGTPFDSDRYHSPIQIHRAQPLKKGTGRLFLAFRNAAYAEGLQHFEMEVQVLKRAPGYVICDLLQTQRCAVITELSPAWLRANFPWASRITADEDLQIAMRRLLGDTYQPPVDPD